MKIKQLEKPYSQVAAIQPPPHRAPPPQSAFLRGLVKSLSAPELRKAGFTCRKIHMERLAPGEPCLVLMNHSSFIDLKIAFTVLSDRPFHTICTSDGFVGKEGFMRALGCVPTRKFNTDTMLVRDMAYILRSLKASVLMFPEASYSFAGTATPLPESLGKCLKLLKVPVVTILTQGAFLRDPLYNNLQVRDVPVSAEMEYLLSPEDIAAATPQELNRILEKKFTVDYFRRQQEMHLKVDEPFRADYLNRVLYKCPVCGEEGRMEGRGETLTCHSCGKVWRLTEYGFLEDAAGGETPFHHIPDWFAWQREQVRLELLAGTYNITVPVEIRMLVDMRAIYHVGSGVLTHTVEGFHLTGCDGALDYRQKPGASYSLYSDYYWYEIGDMISIGTKSALYYCFPTAGGDVAAKARLAAEELYKIGKARMADRDKAGPKGTDVP